MKYIVDKEQIEIRLKTYLEQEDVQEILDLLFEDKQSVEVIESGIVQGDFGYDLGDKLVKHQGEKVTVYIQKEATNE